MTPFRDPKGTYHPYILCSSPKHKFAISLMTLQFFLEQAGLTHDVGAHAFVAFDILNFLPHIFGVVGVEVSPVTTDVSALPSWCKL